MFRLAAHLEQKVAALKVEALHHLFVALAGTDCKELWTLLVQFFGKGTGFDPFEFLDGAPAIKPPLDLGKTDSDEDASETASSVTIGSVSTTASLATDVEASTSTAPSPASRPVPKAKLHYLTKSPVWNTQKVVSPLLLVTSITQGYLME